MDKANDMVTALEKSYIEKQKKLFEKADMNNRVDVANLKYVAGVDLAYWKNNEEEFAVCCIVIIDFATKEVVEKKYTMGKTDVPYIPGCLAFREIDLVLDVTKQLEHKVDLYILDGNGYLHPRHMGLATHAGICLEAPTIGVAKSYYKIENTDYKEPENEEFAYEDIVIKGQVYGRALRTHKNVRPIFLSTGNKTDLKTATEVVKNLVNKESHIPIPTRYADLYTHEMRKQLKDEQI